jgi:hypothetical protein
MKKAKPISKLFAMKKSKQVCPTCGCPVKVVGKTTKHYEPDIVNQDELLEKFNLGIEGGERIILVRLKSIIQDMLDKTSKAEMRKCQSCEDFRKTAGYNKKWCAECGRGMAVE